MVKFESNFNQENTSSSVANKRLRYIITQDRFKLSTDMLLEIKTDIINIISNYIEIDPCGVELNLVNKNNNISMINASIPLKNIKNWM